MHSVTHKNPIISRANSVINEELYDKSSFPSRNDGGGNDEVVRPSEDDFAQFKQQVAEWIKIDDQIRKLSIAIRERKTHQRALGKKVQEFMVKNKYDNLDTKHGVIKSNVKEVAQPIKLAEVRTKIEELDDDTPLTKIELMDKLFETERTVITNTRCKRYQSF